MNIERFVAQSLAAACIFISASAFGQSSGATNSDTDELRAAAEKPGLCYHVQFYDPNKFPDGRITPGTYLFYSSAEFPFDIELVGAGGSGGGTTLGAGRDRWGSGGAAGELKRSTGLKLPRGAYLVGVGKGGASISGSKNHRDWKVHPVNGRDGGDTVIVRCTSEFRIVAAKGGTGGSGDSYPTTKQSGPGGSLWDPGKRVFIGRGGEGGIWQQSGHDGGGWGSGGGGEGSHTHDGSGSGRGGDGYARLVRLKH